MPSVKGAKHYTKQEKGVIFKHVLNNPENLREAFRNSAEELKVTRPHTSWETVSRMYYNRLRKEHTLFTLEGRDQSLSNTKIVHRRTKVAYPVENPTVAQLARQYNKLTSKQKQDFQVLIK